MVQTTYGDRIRPGVPGMVATMHGPYEADTRIVETAAGIPFGVAVSQGAGELGALLGAVAANLFVGISIRDVTLEQPNVGGAVDVYPENLNMGVMTKGDMWVTTGGVVVVGGPVTFNAVTGVLSSIAAGAGQFAITGARWQTAAGLGELAVVRLSDHAVSA